MDLANLQTFCHNKSMPQIMTIPTTLSQDRSEFLAAIGIHLSRAKLNLPVNWGDITQATDRYCNHILPRAGLYARKLKQQLSLNPCSLPSHQFLQPICHISVRSQNHLRK